MVLSRHIINRAPVAQEGRADAGHTGLDMAAISVLVLAVAFDQLFGRATICRGEWLVPSAEHEGGGIGRRVL